MAPSTACQLQSIPFSSSYSSRPSSQSFRKTPARTHSWKRLCAVPCLQIPVASSAAHWHPVRSTYRMPSIAIRSENRGRPPPSRCLLGCFGSNGSIRSHNASDTRNTREPSTHGDSGSQHRLAGVIWIVSKARRPSLSTVYWRLERMNRHAHYLGALPRDPSTPEGSDSPSAPGGFWGVHDAQVVLSSRVLYSFTPRVRFPARYLTGNAEKHK